MRNRLLRQRSDLIDEADEIVKKAEDESRGLSEDESRQIDRLLAKAEVLAEAAGIKRSEISKSGTLEGDLSAEVRHLKASLGDLLPVPAGIKPDPGDYPGGPGYRRAAPPAGPIFVTPDGRQVRGLLPEERWADHVEQRSALPFGIEQKDLSLGRWLRGIMTGDWRGAEAEMEMRALGGDVDASGGYLLPEPLSPRFIDLARAKSAIIPAGTITVPMESKTLTMARLLADPDVYWKSENDLGTEDVSAEFGELRMEAKTIICLIRMSRELVQDASNAPDLVEKAMGDAIGLELDQAGLIGAGESDRPIEGIFNTTGITQNDMGAAAGAALTDYSKFSQCVEDVATANEVAQAVIMHPRDFYALDRLTASGTGQPLQPPESWKNIRKKLVTTAIPTNQSHGTASNASFAAVGDFGGAYLGMRQAIQIEVGREGDDTFKRNQILIRATMRMDFVVARPGAFALVVGIIPA